MAVTAPAYAAVPGILKVRIFDATHQNLVPARVNVIGSDNAFYEPDPSKNPLSEYSLKHKGNRANVGPLRYYGSFFYTDGSFEVKLPPGPARIEVRKGYGYYVSLGEVEIPAGKTANFDLVMQRVIDMPRYGWHSMDTHLHFDRGEAETDRRIAQLLAAEDVELGHILAAHSSKGFGMASIHTESIYSMISGRETTIPALGHVNLLMIDDLIPAIRNSPPGPSVPLAAIYDQALAAKGAMQHDHGGYGQEIYADAVLGKSDLVELLQFGLYRPEIGLDGYYLLLNSGFRYPLGGGSDYPVCRTMSDSIVYVADGARPSFPTAMGRLLKGEAFATSGPLLFLSVDGKGPGSDIEYAGSAPRDVNVQVRAVSGDLPFNTLEIVQNGKVVAEWHGAKAAVRRELKARLRLNASSWIAARCSGPNTIHAHTDPVWVYFNGVAPFQADAAKELLKRIQEFEDSKISPEAKKIAESARNKVEQMLRADDYPPRPSTTYAQRFPISPSNAILFPPVVARPKALAPATIEGMVYASSGRPLAGAAVSVRGIDPPVRTDAAGRFVLRGVDANQPLFLRVTKAGHATTNTQYLNPRSYNLRILVLTDAELKSVMEAWPRSKPDASSQAIVLLNSVDAGGKPIAGLHLSASPAGTTHFGYLDKDGGFSGASSISSQTGPVQIVGVTEINYQPAYPPQSNDHEPNVIVTANPAGKDIVAPAFTGQVTYAVIFENQ